MARPEHSLGLKLDYLAFKINRTSLETTTAMAIRQQQKMS